MDAKARPEPPAHLRDARVEQDLVLMAREDPMHHDLTPLLRPMEAKGSLRLAEHGLSALRECDRFVVLERGRAGGEGAWEASLVGNPTFRALAHSAGKA